MAIRPERVANAIRKEISRVLHEDVKDPHIGFTTITRVQVSPDLKYAKVYYSVLGDKKAKAETDASLKKAKGFIKTIVGNRLKLRFTPEISFRKDKTFEYQASINEILKRLRKERDGQ